MLKSVDLLKRMRYIENRNLEVNAAVKKCRKLLTGFALIIGVLFSMTVYGSTESETEEKQSDSRDRDYQALTAVWHHPVRIVRLEKALRSEAAMRRMIRTM